MKTTREEIYNIVKEGYLKGADANLTNERMKELIKFANTYLQEEKLQIRVYQNLSVKNMKDIFDECETYKEFRKTIKVVENEFLNNEKNCLITLTELNEDLKIFEDDEEELNELMDIKNNGTKINNIIIY